MICYGWLCLQERERLRWRARGVDDMDMVDDDVEEVGAAVLDWLCALARALANVVMARASGAWRTLDTYLCLAMRVSCARAVPQAARLEMVIEDLTEKVAHQQQQQQLLQQMQQKQQAALTAGSSVAALSPLGLAALQNAAAAAGGGGAPGSSAGGGGATAPPTAGGVGGRRTRTAAELLADAKERLRNLERVIKGPPSCKVRCGAA